MVNDGGPPRFGSGILSCQVRDEIDGVDAGINTPGWSIVTPLLGRSTSGGPHAEVDTKKTLSAPGAFPSSISIDRPDQKNLTAYRFPLCPAFVIKFPFAGAGHETKPSLRRLFSGPLLSNTVTAQATTRPPLSALPCGRMPFATLGLPILTSLDSHPNVIRHHDA